MTPILNAGFGSLSTSRAFSSGVVALTGYQFRRITLRTPMPMEAGLAMAADYVLHAQRPVTALCGCELRIPQRLTRAEFSDFNRRYLAALRAAGWTTLPLNPAARTNVAPTVAPPAEPVLSAFTFAVESAGKPRDFVVSGRPELAGGSDSVIAPHDTSSAGMQAKSDAVFVSLKAVVQQLGAKWTDATAAHVYTRHPLPGMGLAIGIMTHLPADPPVWGPDEVPYEFEADIRSITEEDTV